jgi:hypothetical protein
MKLNSDKLKGLIKEVLDEMCDDIPSDPIHHSGGRCADDHEASMAKSDLRRLHEYSMEVDQMIRDGDELEGWVQSKITKAADYIASVKHYLEYNISKGHE